MRNCSCPHVLMSPCPHVSMSSCPHFLTILSDVRGHIAAPNSPRRTLLRWLRRPIARSLLYRSWLHTLVVGTKQLAALGSRGRHRVWVRMYSPGNGTGACTRRQSRTWRRPVAFVSPVITIQIHSSPRWTIIFRKKHDKVDFTKIFHRYL